MSRAHPLDRVSVAVLHSDTFQIRNTGQPAVILSYLICNRYGRYVCKNKHAEKLIRATSDLNVTTFVGSAYTVRHELLLRLVG